MPPAPGIWSRRGSTAASPCRAGWRRRARNSKEGIRASRRRTAPAREEIGMTDEASMTVQNAAARVGSYRWVIVGLLFAATVINYIDRQMLGVLKPTLSTDLGWSEVDFAYVVFWFQTAYAIGYIGFGRIVDLIGARLGYAIAFVIWTIAHIAHGGVHSVTQFALVRFGLGIGEAGNFPAGIKAVTEWFPAKERAFAIGVFNAGANIGAIVTPLVVPFLVV